MGSSVRARLRQVLMLAVGGHCVLCVYLLFFGKNNKYGVLPLQGFNMRPTLPYFWGLQTHHNVAHAHRTHPLQGVRAVGKGRAGACNAVNTPFTFIVEDEWVTPARFVPVSDSYSTWWRGLMLPDRTAGNVSLSFETVVDPDAAWISDDTKLQLGWTAAKERVATTEGLRRLVKDGGEAALSVWLGRLKRATQTTINALLVDVPGFVAEMEGTEIECKYMGVPVAVHVGARLVCTSMEDETIETRRYCKRLQVTTTLTWSAQCMGGESRCKEMVEEWTMKKILSKIGGGYRRQEEEERAAHCVLGQILGRNGVGPSVQHHGSVAPDGGLVLDER